MRRITSTLTLVFFLLAFSSGISFCQTVDLSGTWVGQTEVPDAAEPDELTLVLEKMNGDYRGTISDSFEMLLDEEIEDVEFEDDTLTFNFMVFTGSEDLRVYVTLTVKGDMMSGYWETEDGTSATIEMEKVK